uniref:DUF3778 domain-containing protein n=1 Tax=Oryza nivara TaxID=4536 RepID=A0A0E0IB57_ORYNI
METKPLTQVWIQSFLSVSVDSHTNHHSLSQSFVLKEKERTAARTQPPANWPRRRLLLPNPALALLPCSASSRARPAAGFGATPGGGGARRCRLPGPHSTGLHLVRIDSKVAFLNSKEILSFP